MTLHVFIDPRLTYGDECFSRLFTPGRISINQIIGRLVNLRICPHVLVKFQSDEPPPGVDILHQIVKFEPILGDIDIISGIVELEIPVLNVGLVSIVSHKLAISLE